MKSPTYRLQGFHGVINHSSLPAWLLYDTNSETPEYIDALVASGDYFITLATTLDEISELVKAGTPQAGLQLESLTRTLLYLQRYYTIVRKTADPRQ